MDMDMDGKFHIHGNPVVDTHRTRSATARLPINRTRSSDYL